MARLPNETAASLLPVRRYRLGQATEVELAATRTVVSEQAFTERALRTEADQTKASLDSAERDVGGLREKVSRQARLVTHDVKCLVFVCLLPLLINIVRRRNND